MNHPPLLFSRRTAGGLLVLLSLALAASFPAAAQPAGPTVAIIYDGPPDTPLGEAPLGTSPQQQKARSQRIDTQAKGYIHAVFIDNLLGHFGLRGKIIPLKSYKAGELAGSQAAFFVGVTSNAEILDVFLADVKAFPGPFCWMGQHIERLVNTPEGPRQYGFSFERYEKNFGVNRISYKDALLGKIEPDLAVVSPAAGRGAEVLATAITKEKASYPYVLHRKRFWYFADSPFSWPDEGGHYLAFCDLLHDILEIQHAPDHRALVRIEDVSVDDDPVDLQHVSDLLAGKGVPFQIALIPIFRNPSKEIEIRISDRHSFAESVKYMISRGGTPILHGVTHQYRGQSGDDYEFWDDTGDRPVAGDSTDFVLKRLYRGLADCFSSGIYPVAFETPHYAASETDYRAMMRVFTLFYDRTISTPSLNSQQYFPYPLIDHWGRNVLPENLGYVPVENPDPRTILARARNLRVVRDGMASFYFHPFMDARILGQLVDGIRELGYQFVSIREFPSQVNYQGRFIVRTASGKTSVYPHNEYWRVREFDASGKEVKTEISPQRVGDQVEVAVNVPAGGWSAVDCLPDRPVEQRELTWSERTAQWWGQFWAKERPSVNAEYSGRKAWVLTLDKPTQATAYNQKSYRNVLETFGYQVTAVKPSDFTRAPTDDAILVVPQAAGALLSEAQRAEILRFLNSGGRAVFDGRQEWLSTLGIRWADRQLNISVVADEIYPEMYLRWRPEEKINLFSPPEGILRQFMVDTESSQTLAYSDDYGAGRYIYLAAPLDNHTADGVSHYPYLAKYLNETFGINTPLRATRLETYFDPSYRTAADLNRLAVQWRKSGIRAVYAAAWIYYPQYTFNYRELIRACHRNGVAVYAWLMLPMVTPKMWQDHPEWRERTATGADGNVGWRYTMNLQNPACWRAAMDWMNGMLGAYDWDGVNIAELNFDADFKDYLRPDRFIPMSNEVRSDFRRKAGFDPVQLFQPGSPEYYKENPAALQKFLRYRENIVSDWHRRVLTELEPLRKQKGWEVILTVQDSLHSKYVRPALGVDCRRLVALMKEFNFTLQVEDPAEYWMKPPERYLQFAKTYSKLVKDSRRLMFDINVMSDRAIDGTTLPSATATGTELARTVLAAAAGSGAGRVAVYSEHTIPVQDWQFLRIALTQASTVDIGQHSWKLDSPEPVLLTPAEDRDYYLDGKLWPAVSEDGVLTPSGRHSLSTERPWHHFLDPQTMPARLLSITGDLLDARVMPTGLVFRYNSPGRAIIVLNQRPREILVDGRRTQIPSFETAGAWSLAFPGGEHWVAVVTNTKAGVAVNLWGWASASAITAFGGIATVLMALIYFEVRLRRFLKQLVASRS